jgi:hypothetical protein
MAVVTRPPGERAVARPAWVRRQDSQHEGIVAGIMLALVIVGIVVFLFWGQMLRLVASNPLFHVPNPPTDRPAEGAAPPGPPVVVSLDQPVVPSSTPPATAGSAAPPRPVQDAALPDQSVVLAPAAAGASVIADAPDGAAPGSDVLAGDQPVSDADAAPGAAAARDAAETARAAEEARAVSAAIARAAATPASTVLPAATATRPSLTPTPAVPTPTAHVATGSAASGKRARVVRTGGRGVVMYSAPRQGARLPAGFPEGSVVSVLGVTGDWTQVEGSGRSGWVKSEFLAPE